MFPRWWFFIPPWNAFYHPLIQDEADELCKMIKDEQNSIFFYFSINEASYGWTSLKITLLIESFIPSHSSARVGGQMKKVHSFFLILQCLPGITFHFLILSCQRQINQQFKGPNCVIPWNYGEQVKNKSKNNWWKNYTRIDLMYQFVIQEKCNIGFNGNAIWSL